MPEHLLFAANYKPELVEVYNALGRWAEGRGLRFVLAQCSSEEDPIRLAPDAEIYLAWKFPVTRRVIAGLPRLRLIMASGSGYDHIDVAAATEHGVVVANAPTHNIEDAAEMAFVLILACGRKLRTLDLRARYARWPVGESALPMYRFTGRNLGLVGFGKVARAVAWRARGIGMHVLASDPYVSREQIEREGVQPVDLETLLRTSDFVSLHLRATEETRHFLDEAKLRLMKPTAFVINSSRGTVVDEAALAKALQEGWIAGAGLDVMESEPPAADNPLLALESVVLSGHSGGSTLDAVESWQAEWRAAFDAFLAGCWPPSVVNSDVQPKVPLSPLAR